MKEGRKKGAESGSPDADTEIKTTISLPRDLWLRLKHASIDEGTSIRDMVRNAVENWLERREKK
ncbi:MAG: plasmid partition protein ParG [Candidatus Hadarchaeales archaeon]